MRYLGMVKASERWQGSPPPQALMHAMGAYVQASFKSGILIDTGGLQAASKAIVVRVAKGKTTVVDGPFTETKEVVGGYAVLEYASPDAAIAGTREFMELHATHWPEWEGSCEVRQIVGPNDSN